MDAQALLTPGRGRPLHGRAAGPRARTRPATATPQLRPPLRAPAVHRHLRRPGHPPGPLLLDERASTPTGQMDPFIRTALDRAEVVRDIYRRVANVEQPAGWLPLGVICPSVRQGRAPRSRPTGTARRSPSPACPDLRHLGARAAAGPAGSRRSAARAKLPWNLDWAAQWSLFGVTDRALRQGPGHGRRLARPLRRHRREVFDREPPLNVPYEFLNIGGRKMSTSKGAGAAAHTDRRASSRRSCSGSCSCATGPKQAIEFDPEGTDAIPRLFDEFDRLAAAAAGRPVRGELPPDPERIFRLRRCSTRPRTSPPPRPRFRPAFRHLALLVQIPGVDVEARVAAEKGAPLTRPSGPILAERLRRRPRLAGGATPRTATGSRSGARPCRRRSSSSAPSAARLPAGSRRPPRHGGAPGAGDAWQDLIFRTRAAARGARRRGRLRRPLRSRSWAAPTAPVPAGCWPAWSRLRRRAAARGGSRRTAGQPRPPGGGRA